MAPIIEEFHTGLNSAISAKKAQQEEENILSRAEVELAESVPVILAPGIEEVISLAGLGEEESARDKICGIEERLEQVGVRIPGFSLKVETEEFKKGSKNIYGSERRTSYLRKKVDWVVTNIEFVIFDEDLFFRKSVNLEKAGYTIDLMNSNVVAGEHPFDENKSDLGRVSYTFSLTDPRLGFVTFMPDFPEQGKKRIIVQRAHPINKMTQKGDFVKGLLQYHNLLQRKQTVRAIGQS